MNITSLIKITTASGAIAASTVFSSCIQPAAPQQQATTQGQQQQGINPYAVPGLNGETPQAVDYSKNNNPAPYQPLPGLPSDLPNINVPNTTPNYDTNTESSTATTHDVIAGESLWRISRKYGVTVTAIQQANNLKNDTIWAGQKLNIPAGN